MSLIHDDDDYSSEQPPSLTGQQALQRPDPVPHGTFTLDDGQPLYGWWEGGFFFPATPNGARSIEPLFAEGYQATPTKTPAPQTEDAVMGGSPSQPTVPGSRATNWGAPTPPTQGPAGQQQGTDQGETPRQTVQEGRAPDTPGDPFRPVVLFPSGAPPQPRTTKGFPGGPRPPQIPQPPPPSDREGQGEAPGTDPDRDAQRVKEEEIRAKFAAKIRLTYKPHEDLYSGAVTFGNHTHPRCLSSASLWPPFLKNATRAASIQILKEQGWQILWASVYKTPRVTKVETDLFMEGTAIIQARALVKGFNATDYLVQHPPGGGKAFLLLAKSSEALLRLAHHRVISVKSKAKSATFFIQRDESWGTHIIFDVRNAGANFEKDGLGGVWEYFGSAIALDETKSTPTRKVPRDLAYHQVKMPEKTHKGAKAIVWRVRFIPNRDAGKSTWVFPSHLGFSSKGMREVSKPPLCPHCISTSHAQHECQWWREGFVVGSNRTPKNWEEITWKTVKSFSLTTQ